MNRHLRFIFFSVVKKCHVFLQFNKSKNENLVIFRILIQYRMKSTTITKVSYIIKMNMPTTIHEMNAMNVIAIYTAS